MPTYPEIGVQVGEILLPRPGIDLARWGVIACDQFTSEPEYWQQVADCVGDAPSTFNLVLPEVYLGSPEEEKRVASTRQAMQAYLGGGVFTRHQGMILVERQVNGSTRHGLMLALDLERYDYGKGSHTLIRATEGTILDRLPSRIRIREGAPLELPHILVLIDDPECTVIEPLLDHAKRRLSPLYETDLMLGSGHLTGYSLADPAIEARVIDALRALAEPAGFYRRHNLSDVQGVSPHDSGATPRDSGVLLFAMGDGNHSFATAKAIWEKVKHQVGPNHPARYALVEIENVHDEGLAFEPIHRVLFNVKEPLQAALSRRFGDQARCQPLANAEEMIRQVNAHSGPRQAVGVIGPEGAGLLTFLQPTSNLSVGSLQAFLDAWLAEGGFGKIDYVHGDDVVARLGAQPGQLGFYLPAMPKTDLFRTVLLDGALPRKTFSMGSAREKRFYFEARRITA